MRCLVGFAFEVMKIYSTLNCRILPFWSVDFSSLVKELLVFGVDKDGWLLIVGDEPQITTVEWIQQEAIWPTPRYDEHPQFTILSMENG